MMKSWILEGGPTPNDRGFTHGLGVFETLLALDGELVRPEWHFERMETGCGVLDIVPPDREAVRAALQAELGSGRQRVRIARTAGSGVLNQLRGEDPRTVLTIAPCPEPPSSLRVITAPWPRNEANPLTAVKCLSYAENLMALDVARHAGADEAVFFNTQGELCEGACSNVFVERDGELFTPPLSSGCLPGTFRRGLIESGQAVEKVLSVEDVRGAQAIYLSSATRGLVRVGEWIGL